MIGVWIQQAGKSNIQKKKKMKKKLQTTNTGFFVLNLNSVDSIWRNVDKYYFIYILKMYYYFLFFLKVPQGKNTSALLWFLPSSVSWLHHIQLHVQVTNRPQLSKTGCELQNSDLR